MVVCLLLATAFEEEQEEVGIVFCLRFQKEYNKVEIALRVVQFRL